MWQADLLESDPNRKAQHDEAADELRRLHAANTELLEALDTLTAVVGLTPVVGNKVALQEAFDLARAAIAKATEVQS
jgi:hypothetical protein